jgi:hypothetical protein
MLNHGQKIVNGKFQKQTICKFYVIATLEMEFHAVLCTIPPGMGVSFSQLVLNVHGAAILVITAVVVLRCCVQGTLILLAHELTVQEGRRWQLSRATGKLRSASCTRKGEF